MYRPARAEGLRCGGLEGSAVAERRRAGRSDPDVLDGAAAAGCVLLSENVSAFARIVAGRITAGGHDAGVLIVLSSCSLTAKTH